MTHRLYYTDAELTSFEATVLSSQDVDGRAEVVLDATAFYPTSGGQPHDLGTLGPARVLDVVDREDDDTVVHVLDRSIAPGARVGGRIDRARRLDHMQQHTGQHILSAAFDRLFTARTTSFHMGADGSTIDLARDLSAAQIDDAERLANEVVWRDVPVGVRFVSPEEAARLPLRKEPARTGTLRLVEIPDVDLSACGGTHVPRTGVIGLIGVTGWERFKGGSRVGFVCGGRARTTFGRWRDVTTRTARVLSAGLEEIPASIERLQGELRTAGRARDELAGTVAGYRGAAWRTDAETLGGLRAVLREEPGGDAASLKLLAGAVVADGGYVAVLVGGGQPAPVVVARSADVSFDAARWVKGLIERFGGRGGGRPELAQAGIPAGPQEILAKARVDLGDPR